MSASWQLNSRTVFLAAAFAPHPGGAAPFVCVVEEPSKSRPWVWHRVWPRHRSVSPQAKQLLSAPLKSLSIDEGYQPTLSVVLPHSRDRCPDLHSRYAVWRNMRQRCVTLPVPAAPQRSQALTMPAHLSERLSTAPAPSGNRSLMCPLADGTILLRKNRCPGNPAPLRSTPASLRSSVLVIFAPHA